jgi:amino acid adenylation domain-containing protein
MSHQEKNSSNAYALAPMQQGMLFNSLLSEHSGVDIEQIVFELHEDLNVALFEEAWRGIIQRHEVLRTSFHWEELKTPLQAVHQEVALPFEHNDWRDLTGEEQASRLQELIESERCRGFDFSTPPLMRLVLCQAGRSLFHLVWTFSHALLDGRSFTLVIKEVFAIYEALQQNREPKLPPARPYREYIEWLEQQEFSKSEEYWRSQLQGFTATTPLVIDQLNSDVDASGTDYKEHWLRISEPLTTELLQLAVRHEVTLNTLVQGAWALLLGRYSGETDLVFGVTRAGRKCTVEGADSMVGLFINTLPVRVRLAPESGLISWLQEMREQQIGIREHERTPLIQVQQWSELPNGAPLFESLVVFDRATLDSVLRSQGGAWLNRHFRVIDQTNFPLTLFAYGEPAMLFKISYDQRRLDPDAVARMGTHLETLLESMAADPTQKLGTVQLLPEAERQRVLVDWNRTGQEYPDNCCLHEAIEAQARMTPDAMALVCGEDQLTYRELDMRASQLAKHLRSFKVGPEVFVGVCMEVSLDMMVGLLAVLKAGGAYVPLDPAYPKDRLTFMLKDAQSPVLLTQQKFADLFPGTQAAVVYLENGKFEPAAGNLQCTEARTDRATSDNLAYVLYTSGSTGQPKGVMVTHRNILNFFAGMDQHLKKESGVWLAVTSISFDISVLELFWTLSRGFKVVLQRREENLATATARQIVQHHVTHLQCTPSMAEMLLRDPEARQALRSLRQLLLGGEALSPELARQLHISGEILNMYGPTETTVWSTTHKVNGEKSRVPIGRPLANTEIYILDQQLRPVPIGVPGELFIGGAGVVRGYFERNELTAEKFISNPFKPGSGARLFKTGDRTRYLADGTIEFLGRLDNQVKLRGFRIEPGEIESTLRQHPGVRECVVVVREFAPRDSRLVAYVVPVAESALTASSLRELLKSRLPDYMIPSAFVLLEAFPLTPNGKINRRALPAPERELQPEKVIAPPNSDTEKKLVEIWLAVLGRKQIGIHDNFFEQGGHSLLAMQVVSQVRAVLDKHFSIVQLYQHPTIYTLAKCLTSRSAALAARGMNSGPIRSRRQIRWPRRPIQFRQAVQQTEHARSGRSNENPNTPSACRIPKAMQASPPQSQPD